MARNMLRNGPIIAIGLALLAIQSCICEEIYWEDRSPEVIYSEILTSDETSGGRSIAVKYEAGTTAPTTDSQTLDESTASQTIDESTASQTTVHPFESQTEVRAEENPLNKKDILGNAIHHLQLNKGDIHSFINEISNGKVSLEDISDYDGLVLGFINSLRESGGGLNTKFILLLLDEVQPTDSETFKDNLRNTYTFPASDVINTFEYLNSREKCHSLSNQVLSSLYYFLEINSMATFKQSFMEYGLSKGYAHAIMLLLSNDPAINQLNENGDTLLHLAAKKGMIDSINILLDDGLEINKKNKEGLTALYYAAKERHLEVGKLLVSRGADIDSKDENGDSLLHIAVGQGDIDTARLLIELGVSIDEDNNGITPLYLAAQFDNKEIMAMLMEKGADKDHRNKKGDHLIQVATLNNHITAVRNLLDLGVDINTRGPSGFSPLHIAARSGLTQMLQLLLDRGAMVDSTWRLGRTPLHEAAYWGHLTAAQKLISHGANPGYPDRYGNKPVNLAEWGGHKLMIRLIKKGEEKYPTIRRETHDSRKFDTRQLRYLTMFPRV